MNFLKWRGEVGAGQAELMDQGQLSGVQLGQVQSWALRSQQPRPKDSMIKYALPKFVTVSEKVYQDIEIFVLFLSEMSLAGKIMSLLEFHPYHEDTKNTSENNEYSSCYLEIIFHAREMYF